MLEVLEGKTPFVHTHHYFTCQIRHLGACGAEKDVKG